MACPLWGMPWGMVDALPPLFSTPDHSNLMRSMLAINLTIIPGYIANLGIAEVGLKLPLFVPYPLISDHVKWNHGGPVG